MEASPALPALDNTFGALLIGTICSAALYGVTCVQTYYYFLNYSDTFFVKIVVISLLLLETLHTAFIDHAVYYYLVSNYFNPLALSKATWSAISTLWVSNCIMLVVHLFYARRVYYVSRKNVLLTAGIVALALAHVGVSIAVSIRAFQIQFFTKFGSMKGIIDSSLGLAVAADSAIAISLTYYLHTSRSGLASTDKLINKLMVYAINNGIVTSLFDILTLIFVTTEVDNLIFLSIYEVVGSLYTNSVLATLNSRTKTAAKMRMGSTGTNIPLSSIRIGQHQESTAPTQIGTDKGVHVEQTTFTDSKPVFA